MEDIKESKATNVDGYICEVCCKGFAKEEYLRAHREKVHTDKRFACSLCDKVLKSREAIKKHMAIHTGERNYICKHCGKDFSDPSSRNAHEKYQHPPAGQEIVCKECGKQFKYPRGLRLHMVHHNQGIPYDGQRKQYSNELKLEALKWVTEIGAADTAKKFNVPYSAVRNWMDATKSHVTKSHYCHTCDKTFQSKQRLAEHERVTHSALAMSRGKGFKFPPEFKREVCDFAQATSTKEACEKYGLGESTVRGFIKLLLNPIHCPHCSRKCKNQSQLAKHMDEVHKIGHYRPNTAKESLNNFLETENVDKEMLSESMTYQSRMQTLTEREIDPSNIEVYDPTKPKEVKPKEVKEKKKRVRKKKEQPMKVIKEENGDEVKVKVKMKRVRSNQGDPKVSKKTKVIIDPSSSLAKMISYEILDEIINEFIEVEESYILKEEGGEAVKMEMEIDGNYVKEEVLEEEECEDVVDFNENDSFSDVDYPDIGGGELDHMDPEDLNAFMNIMNEKRRFSEDTEIPLKAERLSTNMKEEAESEDDNGNDQTLFGDSNSNVNLKFESHHDFKTSRSDKSDTDSDEDYKASIPIENKERVKKPKTYKKPNQKKDAAISPKKVRAFQPKPEHLIDFNIDLSQYGIREEDDVFVIQSKFTNIEQFMDVVLSKKYKAKRKIFSCSECPKSFKNACDFKRHMTVHTSERNFLCEFCHMSFSFKSNLVRHIQKQHEEKGVNERFKCQYCPNEYKDRSSLKTHELRHTEGSNPHQCSICGKSYAAIQSLKDHIKYIHEGETPPKHICPVCGKEFKKIQNFKAHHRAHLYGKEFECELCGQTFQQRDSLRQHKLYRCKNADTLLRIENREKYKQKFPCTVPMCDKVYSDKRNLLTHIQIIHEGKTDNFVCDICSKSFSRRTSLVAHKMLHTGEFKIFSCENCSASFKDKRYYVRHREKCHKFE